MKDLVVGGLIACGLCLVGLAIYNFPVPIVGIIVVIIAVYCVVLGLAKANILCTIVGQGWCRIILKWGEYERTIGPGLHWIGIPGIHTLYSRKMTFLKSKTDKDGKPQAEPHEDEDISSFKTTDYPYAFPFMDEEDNRGLPLSGFLAVMAVIEDYKKAFFKASDWYSVMNTEIMPCFRDELVRVSYDDYLVGRNLKKEQEQPTFNDFLREAINRLKDGSSVVSRLYDLYGIKIISIELRSVDPPPDWRAITLAPYKAEREKAAAKYQAETSAMLFDDTNQALKVWLRDQRKTKHHPTQVQIEAKQDELRQRALAKTQGYQQIHIKGLENATTAVVGGGGGGGTGILVGGQGGNPSKPGKNPGGKGSGVASKDIVDMNEAELDEWARRSKKRKGSSEAGDDEDE
jgi:regulator of protease activity HflC (stomatin/prohibitin superfamily)